MIRRFFGSADIPCCDGWLRIQMSYDTGICCQGIYEDFLPLQWFYDELSLSLFLCVECSYTDFFFE